MKREYWSVGKPGYIWCFLDICPANDDLRTELSKKYKVSSEYFNNKGALIAVTFEVPAIELLNIFTRIP